MLSLLLVLGFVHIQAEISLLSEERYIYNESPSLCLQFSNLTNVSASNITLSIGAKDSIPLVSPHDLTLGRSSFRPQCLFVNLTPEKK